MTDKDKEKATPEQRKEILNEIKDKLREAQNSAPPYSLGDLLRLIEIVQDRDPEAGEAIDTLIKRYFTRRRVLFIIEERLRLEEMWKLELSLDHDTNELSPLNYERDVAPVPVFETVGECEDFLLGELKYRMRKLVRNKITNNGAQGRGIDTKEVEREQRLQELPEQKTIHHIPGTGKYKALTPKDKLDKSSEMGSSGDESLWDIDKWNTPETVDPWDPRTVVDITEDDRPQWEAICKAIPLLDDIDQILVESIMYGIPIVKQSKKYGVPEGTLRSRKSRLTPKVLKLATKWLSPSVSYIEGQVKVPPKQGKRPPNIGP